MWRTRELEHIHPQSTEKVKHIIGVSKIFGSSWKRSRWLPVVCAPVLVTEGPLQDAAQQEPSLRPDLSQNVSDLNIPTLHHWDVHRVVSSGAHGHRQLFAFEPTHLPPPPPEQPTFPARSPPSAPRLPGMFLIMKKKQYILELRERYKVKHIPQLIALSGF